MVVAAKVDEAQVRPVTRIELLMRTDCAQVLKVVL